MKTTLTKHQMKTYRKDYTGSDGRAETIIVNIRYDDQCGNGHNTFAMTAEIYTQDRHPNEPKLTHKGGKVVWLFACGCQHEEIEKHFPDLRKYVKWHLCSSDGPMHYVANTVYHAKERAISKGWIYLNWSGGQECLEYCTHERFEQIKAEFYPPLGVPYKTSMTYEPNPKTAKARELDAARNTAIWPDATDEDLTTPGLEDRLKARLPKLLEDFKADMEALGFVF